MTKGIMEFDDSLGVCRFNSGLNLAIDSEAIDATAGWNLARATETAKDLAIRAVNMRAHNLRVGIVARAKIPKGSSPMKLQKPARYLAQSGALLQ